MLELKEAPRQPTIYSDQIQIKDFLGMAAMPFPLCCLFDIEDNSPALFIITKVNFTYAIPCNDIFAS